MELMPFLIIGSSLLSAGIPVLGTIAIWASLYALSPYVRGVFSRNVGWRSLDPASRDLSLTMTPWAFALVGIGCVSIALVAELVAAVMLQLLFTDARIMSFLLVVSAGPIEEASKLAIAMAAFAVLRLFLGRKAPRDPVRDGILVGMFVGCSFGFTESIGYLVMGFSDLLSHGVMFSTVDPLAWRAFLGVLVHGMYTAIASVGLGRPNARGLLGWTAIGLSVAIALHSLNNGVQGLFLIVLGLEGLPIYLLVDSVQLLLIVTGAVFLISVWRKRRSVPLVQPAVA